LRGAARKRQSEHGPYARVVIAGLDPAIHPIFEKLLAKEMDARVISAFRRVFNAPLRAYDALDKLPSPLASVGHGNPWLLGRQRGALL
jgi:hypothetical protein